MGNFLYVDNSNVWIEGMHVAAVASGAAPDIFTAQQAKITDRFVIDFGKLRAFAGGETSEVSRAVLYGSRPPANDSLWKAAEAQGFDIVVYDRNAANREKKIDTKIATDIIADSFARVGGGDEITLVAGDRDYVPVGESLSERGVPFHVIFWNHAARELKSVATTFTDLDPYLEHLRRE